MHTGNKTRLVFAPAPVNTGVKFVRTDLPGAPAVAALAGNVSSVCRGTTIAAAHNQDACFFRNATSGGATHQTG